ncbi:M20/M25/M40 family metallo-hydrolase [Deinococcus radiophilus]|uniref:M20/M25/M40 family metallo-hydrolase n=1 Tax=Deinococcus radiophilus TaxID=32062 RepID=A0A3S0JUW0_9DEIO|nr:M20/M25/M40 family metallo-hydrolase [Deinococcus radiophilus]RTR29390.1 M20/M25/M40 family metallo-hydrolase [Deinococcus radiophilus]
MPAVTMHPSASEPAAPQDWSSRTLAWLDQLVSWPSEGGTAGEQAFAGQLADELAQLPYFQEHPEQLWRQTAWPDGPENLFALVRGSGRQTAVLSGHFDTVTTRNYGSHAPLACSPLRLRDALIHDLQQRGDLSGSPSLQLALEDLQSGDFLPGRGALDMKAGLAAGLAVLEAWIATPPEERPGNLLLTFSPDEEDSSRGARAARSELYQAAQRWDLELTAGINLDATSDQGDGSAGRAVYLGTVGKLLPVVCFVGRDTHAGFPFEGVSAHAMNAELLRRLELNPQHADSGHGETAPPPICLESRDFRGGYDVTTPQRVWSAYNVLSHTRTPPEVLELICAEAQAAMQEVLARHRAFAQAAGQTLSEAAPITLSLGELRAEVLGTSERQQEYAKFLDELEQETNPLLASARAMHWLLDRSDRRGPLAVVGFGSLHYPASHVSEHGNAGKALQQAIQQVAERHGLTVRQYFAGISDMSFIGQPVSQSGENAVTQHLAAPTSMFCDQPGGPMPVFPTVNLGPWGRDYHQWLERVHLPYASQGLPAAVWDLAWTVLHPDA